MPGVGGDGAALLPVAVQGDGVEALVLHPVAVLDQGAQRLGPVRPFESATVAKYGAHLGQRLPGGEGVALDLQQGDRPLGKAAVGVEDGVFRVLPALVRQASVGRTRVVDQAVAVAVAVVAYPARRRDQMGPQGAHRLIVVGALGVGAGQGDEQTGGVDAPVVEAEGHLAQHAHLAAARLVHDLAGGRVHEGVGLGRLARGQIGQHPLGQAGVDPQHLPGGDDAVATERGREPRHPRIRIGAGRQVGGQKGDVGPRLP
ncbi:hypothetical protein D3C73_618630 [compost metagenome]